MGKTAGNAFLKIFGRSGETAKREPNTGRTAIPPALKIEARETREEQAILSAQRRTRRARGAASVSLQAQSIGSSGFQTLLGS